MCNKGTQFSDFVECDGMVQIASNDMVPSYGAGTVRVISVVDGLKHDVALPDVIYTPGIMNSLIFKAQVWKNRFPVMMGDGLNNARRGRMDLKQKSSGRVGMCGFETSKGLYEPVLRLCRIKCISLRLTP